MSKIDFKEIVQKVLLEVTWLDQEPQEPANKQNTSQTPPRTTGNYPEWFVSILKQHEKLGLGRINNNDIRTLFNIGVKTYISQEDARQVSKYILILDVIKSLYEQATPKPAKNINAFFASPQINQIGDGLAKDILTYTNKSQWVPQTAQVANAYKAIKTSPLSIAGRVVKGLGALTSDIGPVN